MFNTRPIQDPRLAQALAEVQAIYRTYDLAGGCMLVSENEAAFTYPIYTNWNIIVEDDSLAMGFRFRLKEAEQGKERAHALMLGTAHMLCVLKDFGQQTQVWMGDLLRILRKTGVQITHTPFNGEKLARISSEPPGRG